MKGEKKSWDQRQHINEFLFLHYFNLLRNSQWPNEKQLCHLDDFVRGFFKSETVQYSERKRWEKISKQSTVKKVSLFKIYLVYYVKFELF